MKADCSVSDYNALFHYILPKILKKEKRAAALVLEAANIIGLENVSDEQKIRLVVSAVDIYEDKICSKLTKILSKKINGVSVHSLKVRF